MKLKELTSEAWRNLATGTSKTLTGIALLTLIIVAVLGMDGRGIQEIFLSQRGIQNSGAATIIVTAQGQVDGQQCTALGEVQGVQGAFALRAGTKRLPIATLPDSSPPLYDVTGDIATTLGGTISGVPGVFLSTQLAQQLGTSVGGTIPIDGTDQAVAGIFHYPDDGRNSQLAAAATQNVPRIGRFDSCWFTVWPANSVLESLTHTVLTDGTDPQEVTTSRLNQSFGQVVSTDQLIAQRSAAYLPIVGSALIFAITLALVRSRRVELALALHLGQSRQRQVLQISLEFLVQILLAALLGSAVFLLLLTPELTGWESQWLLAITLRHILALAVAALAGTVLGVTTMSSKRLQAWTKDR